MISKLIRNLFFTTLVAVTVPVIIGLVTFLWVLGLGATILSNIISWFNGK